jgi:alpha-N-arabinofuranosidase
MMDRERAYSGDQSPLVRLEGRESRGIQQAGLALRRGQGYTGRVVVAAESGAHVTVSLVWGQAPDDRQTITLSPLRVDYTKFPLEFSVGADTDDGRIEIAGTGEGTFCVGAVSLMPADNIKGFRADATALLRQLDSGYYRFPGGNFLSGHDWEDAIGDIDRRPPKWDFHWGTLQPNDVGTDEFMVLCELLGVEPYITVNAGFGDARSAANLVEYANGSVDTPYGKLRAANGHPEPYNIRMWNIGNEPYGWWQLGHMALNQYAMKHNMFAKAMRQKDPSIFLFASGAMLDEMTVTTNARRTTGNVLAESGTESDWTGGLIERCWGNFDALTEHWYVHSGMRFDLETGQTCTLGTRAGFIPVEESLTDWARRGANRVRCKAECWSEYLRRFPDLKNENIYVNIDEWNCGGRSGMRANLSIAWVFHEMFRHTDFINMAAFTMGTACIRTNRTEAHFSSTGLLFKMYREHFGTIPVEVTGNSPQPAPKWPVGGDQPKVNAGSETYPLDLAAAWSSDRKTLAVAILNPTESAQPLDINFKGVSLSGRGRMCQMTGPDLQTYDRFDQPAAQIAEQTVEEVPASMTVPAACIQIYRLEAQ